MADIDAVVGKRISIGYHRGTVRYRGPVPPSKGEWLGIEWDDPTRGRHDGTSADGTRYFHVRIPGSGSFIRPTASRLCCGCSFLQALRNKYSPEASIPLKAIVGDDKQQYSRKNLAEIEIEAPNMEAVMQRTARLDRLREVGLGGWRDSEEADAAIEHGGQHSDQSDFQVAKAFDRSRGETEGSIRKTCPNIRWLDLSRSLLPTWEEVSLISTELDRLQALLLHFNRFSRPPEPIPQCWADRFATLEDLRLDGTLIDWPEMLQLAPAFKNIRNLQLGSNQLTKLTVGCSGQKVFPELRSLSLEDNRLESWQDLASALAPLPKLQSLNLTRNRISLIPRRSADAGKLASLQELHLVDNLIDSWSSLENLDTWITESGDRGLQALHIARPEDRDAKTECVEAAQKDLLDAYEYRDFRAIAIARLAHLQTLDHTEITSKERNDAELFVYTRFKEGEASIIFGKDPTRRQTGSRDDDASKVILSREDKRQRFPRYAELARRFDGDESGSVLSAEQMQSQADADREKLRKKDTLRSKMISLKIHLSASQPSMKKPYLRDPNQNSTDLQILTTTPLRLAKMKLARAVGIKPTQIAGLWVMLQERQGLPESEESGDRIVFEVDDLSRSLDWYEVGDGDELVVVTDT